MTSLWVGRTEKENWYYLAVRHVDTAVRLFAATPSLDDGAWFHAHHAFECMTNALIVGMGAKVPGSKHPVRHGKPQPYRLTGSLGPAMRPIRAQGTHQQRIEFVEQYMSTTSAAKPYQPTYNKLKSWVNVSRREQSLYYDYLRSTWPPDQFSHSDTLRFIVLVRRFIRLLWRDVSMWP